MHRTLENVIIPNGVTSIVRFPFTATSLKSVTVKATTPPEFSGLFGMRTPVEKIYVPAGSVDAYKTANGWNRHADKIEAITE